MMNFSKKWTQAYLACVAFVDDQIGKILDSLENSEYAKNTIVILTSDHGFHMGEKDFIYKQSLWDRGTKVPLMISGIPGMVEGKNCTQPVSLIDIYPTFVDLCQLPKAPNKGKSNYPLEGFSLKTLALDPKGEWMGPDVAITALPGKDHIMNRQFKGALFPHFSVRSEEWRYTLSSTGEEELYNYRIDPDEFTNLANNPEYFSIKNNLRKNSNHLEMVTSGRQ